MTLALAVLFVLIIVGTSTFAVFEVETPPWRKATKWGLVLVLTLLAQRRFGSIAVALPVILGLAGLTFHFIWCRRNGIHPLKATPRRKYYALRGWQFPD
jgi:hypothetical protein